MNATLIGNLISQILSTVPPDRIRELVDDLLDVLEEKAAQTATPIDDAALKLARRVLSIPDDIGGDED